MPLEGELVCTRVSSLSLGYKLVASKCGGDTTLLRLVSSRMVLLGCAYDVR